MVVSIVAHVLVLLAVAGVALAGPGSQLSRTPAADFGITLAVLAWLLAAIGAWLADPDGNLGGFIVLAWWSLFAVVTMAVVGRVTAAMRDGRPAPRPTVASVLPACWSLAYVAGVATGSSYPTDSWYLAASIAWALWLAGYLVVVGLDMRRTSAA